MVGSYSLFNKIKMSWNLMCPKGFLVSRKRQPYSLFSIEKRRMTFLILLGTALFNTNQYFSYSTPPLQLELVYSLQWFFMVTCHFPESKQC